MAVMEISIIAFQSDDPSSNPAKVYTFYCNVFAKERKEAQVDAFLNEYFGMIFTVNPTCTFYIF